MRKLSPVLITVMLVVSAISVFPVFFTDGVRGDTTSPEITDVLATPDMQETGGHVNITATVTDNVAVDTVTVDIGGPEEMTNIPDTDTYYYNATYTEEGIYEYFILAIDTSENENTSDTYEFEIIEVDSTPPEITEVAATPDTQVTSGHVNITATVTDNVGVDTVKVNITYPDSSTVNVTMNEGSYYYDAIYAEIGTYDYFIWANDTSGNNATSDTYQFEITLTDTTPPEITEVAATPPSQETGGHVNITATVTDNVGVDTVKVNITYPDSSTVNVTMNEGSYYYDAIYAEIGTYDYFIWANDTSGNNATSDIYQFEITASAISFGSEYIFNSAATDYTSVSALNSTHFVVAYKDEGGSDHGICRIGAMSGDTISYGSEYVFHSAATDYTSVSALNSTHFVVVYEDSVSGDGTAIIGTVSGSTILYGSEYVFDDAGTTTMISVSFFDSIHFVVSWSDDDANGVAIVGSVSGSTITFGSSVTFNAGWTPFTSVSTLDSTHCVIGYTDHLPSQYGVCKIGIRLGNGISYGSAYTFNSAVSGHISVSSLDATHFAVSYNDDNANGGSRIGVVSGSTITYGAENVFNPANSGYTSVSSFNSTHFVVAYMDSGNSEYGTIIIGVVSVSTITYGAEHVFNTGDSRYNSVSTFDNVSFVVAYRDYSNSEYGTAVLGTRKYIIDFPELTNPVPANNSIASVPVTTSIDYSHDGGLTSTIRWYFWTGSFWYNYATDSGATNGTKVHALTNATDPATTYNWAVKAEDSAGNWGNTSVLSFTTAANNPPTQSGEVPANDSTGIGLIPDLYALCNDADNDNLNATWWSNSSGSWVQFASNWTSFADNTNITQPFTNGSACSTIYYWSVNLTDGVDWCNETYHFTTAEILSPPIADFTFTPSNPSLGELVSFYDLSTDEDGRIVSWSWIMGDGNTAIIQNPTNTYGEGRYYTISLMVTDDDGRIGTAIKILRAGGEEGDIYIPPFQPPKYPSNPFSVPEMYQLLRANIPGSAEVVIVTIDSGNYPQTYGGVDLTPIINIFHPSYPDGIDEFGHGTWVNYAVRYGIQTYCPNAIQYSIRAFDEKGQSTPDIFLQCLDMAKDLNPDIVTISAGIIGTADDVFSKKVSELRRAGIFVIVSAGNLGPQPSTVTSPAIGADAVAIGAIDPMQINGIKSVMDLYDDEVTEWSSRGPIVGIFPKPDFTAPGESIIGPWLLGELVASGTSMAAPLVASCVLQIMASNRGLLDAVRLVYGNQVYLDIIETSLVDSAYDKGDPNSYGWGIPNTQLAAQHAWLKAVWYLAVFVLSLVVLMVSIFLVWRWTGGRKKKKIF